MSEVLDKKPLEARIADLEKTIGYGISQVDFETWRRKAYYTPGGSTVDWGQASGFQYEVLQHTAGASVCFSGVIFRKESGIYIPNLFHFLPSKNKELLIRKGLNILTDEKVVGLVGSMEMSFDRDVSRIYTDNLGLIPIRVPHPGLFNILVSPHSKEILYSFT